MPDTDLLALPEDVRGWSDEHVLIALAAGAPMRCCYCAAEHYPRLAAQMMAGEPIGSSAGGEQPKSPCGWTARMC